MCPQLSTLVTIEYGGQIDTRESKKHNYTRGKNISGVKTIVFIVNVNANLWSPHLLPL